MRPSVRSLRTRKIRPGDEASIRSVYKEVWEAADAEEMQCERAIARNGKLPVKDPFVSGSPFTG